MPSQRSRGRYAVCHPDPTSRKLVLPSGLAVLLVEYLVGFVSRLPHHLVEAFRSTLEEAAWSDVIVRVADACDDQREEQLAVTDQVLARAWTAMTSPG